MTPAASPWILLFVALLAANLPFFIERIFFVLAPRSGRKAFIWRLLELVVLYFLVGGVAYLLERNLGEVARQHWEFYAVTASLFLVFAFPGFIYKYLWHGHG